MVPPPEAEPEEMKQSPMPTWLRKSPYGSEPITVDNFSWEALEKHVGGCFPLHRLIIRRDFSTLADVVQAARVQDVQKLNSYIA